LIQEGAFLVRASESDAKFPFTICVLHNGALYNIRIRKRHDHKFALGNPKDKETVSLSDLTLLLVASYFFHFLRNTHSMR